MQYLIPVISFNQSNETELQFFKKHSFQTCHIPTKRKLFLSRPLCLLCLDSYSSRRVKVATPIGLDGDSDTITVHI